MHCGLLRNARKPERRAQQSVAGTALRAAPFALLFRSAWLLALTAGLATAQQFPFRLLFTSGTNVTVIANGSSIAFNSEIGKPEFANVNVKATYTGTGQVVVSQPPQVLGPVSFTVNLAGTLPLTLNPGDSLSFDIAYKPTSASFASAQLSIFLAETVLTTPTTGPPVLTTLQESIVLLLQGTSPSFTLSYVFQTNLNVVPLQSGGSIIFPGTQTNTTALANLNIGNSGSGFGLITAITPPAGTAFKLTGLPLFPVTLPAGQALQLLIAYTPTAVGTDTDQVQITLASGTILTVGLSGDGISAKLTYQLLQGDTAVPFTPPGPIALPDTDVGATSSVIVLVQNTGNANGVLNAPGSAGGFPLSDLPLFPQTLKPNDSFTFTINFTPSQPGPQKGQLVIGSDLFTLTGNGLGPKLTFSYISAAGTITLGPTAAIVFSPVTVTQSEQVTFVIANTGTQPANVSNIGVGESKSPFSVSGLSQTLPLSLDPGASAQLTITFAPSTTGFSNGTLRIDTTVIVLTGSGTAPPPLPSFTIQGPSGNVAPQTQPGILLKLASAYPVALAGTLTLTTSSTQVSDPAVQFSSGGRVVPFVIPANSTNANFAGQGPQIFLQTGTVASTIILTPNFLTQDGGINLTPSAPATLQFTIAPAAPTLLAASVNILSTTSFTLNVTGYSTIRSINAMTVQFTPAAGFNLSGSPQVTIDLRQSSALWFQSTASQSFGGQFTVSIPFTLSGTNLAPGQTLTQAIASVSAIVTNDVGSSNSLPASL